jgi:hypothetical protein
MITKRLGIRNPVPCSILYAGAPVKNQKASGTPCSSLGCRIRRDTSPSFCDFIWDAVLCAGRMRSRVSPTIAHTRVFQKAPSIDRFAAGTFALLLIDH